MKKHFIKTMLLALLCAVGGVGAAWADEVTVPTPVYFNDFSSTDGLTIKGSGEFITDDDERFGQFYHNDPNLTKAVRTNYLLLPSDVLQHSATTKQMTIGFWVNKKKAADYFYAPIFTAYGADNGTKSHAWSEDGTNGWWPFFYAETRGILQWNSNGFCDFTDNQNVAGTNVQRTNWIDDGKWHYYTMTFTASSAIVYVDGEILNSWSIADNGLDGLFTQTNLTYVCLGGNQAFGWNDADPAFGFDDFAVYDAALSAEQIAQIMTNKMADGEEVNNDITTIPSSFNYSAANATIRPFDAGTIMAGTNVKALTINNTTATAWFDSDTETEGRQAYSIAANEKVTFTVNPLHGYFKSAKDAIFSIVNSAGVELASYNYNADNCNITNVKIGGTQVDGFSSFAFQSRTNATQGANGLVGNNRPYVTTAGYNPTITISISGTGYVEFSFVESQINVNKQFSGTLSVDAVKDLAKITVSDPNTNGDRTYHISSLAIASETVSEAIITYQYEDLEGNSLAEIKANQTAPATIGANVADVIPAGYIANFYNGDNTMKYVYSSFACTDETVPAEGTTVTLKFTPYAKYTHNVMAVDEESNEIGEVATGSAFADESMTLHWSKYVKFDDQWYVTTTYGGTYTEGGTTNITFQTADIIDFIECENTNYNTAGDQKGATNASGGVGVLLQSGKAMATKEKVAAGKYDISLYAYVRRANADKLTLQYSADGSAWTDVETLTFESSKAQTQIAYNVELAEDSYIRFVDAGNQNSCHYYDYIVIAPHHNTYTIKTSAGTVIAKGTCDEGQEYTVAVSEVVADGGKFYVLSDESVVNYTKTFTMGSGDEVQTINYTEDPTIVYYTEGTGISYMNEVAAEGYSAGNYVTVNTSANHGNARNRGYSVGNLAAGQYEITASIVGSNGRNICVRTNDGDYNSGNAPLVSLRNAGIRTGNFALGAEKAIVITGANNGDADGAKSGHMEDFDYIIIRKTSDVAAEIVNVTDAGYATYYSENPLDFTGTGLTAYIAEVNGSAVSFTEVTSVPAKTGVLVKGDKGAYTVNVVSSSTDVSTNAFVGVLDYTKVKNTGIYVLMNGANGVGFYKTTADAFTVSARTAYLPATASGRAFIGFDDETTGIKTVSNAAENNGMIFNLNGQRVSSPKGGLYIKNGKKVIIK